MIDPATLLIVLSVLIAWLRRREQEVVVCLVQEDRLPRRPLANRRRHLTDDDRRRLAALVPCVRHGASREIVTVATPDTSLRRHVDVSRTITANATANVLGSAAMVPTGVRERRVRRRSKMRNRLMGVRILLIAALASSAVAFAQNGERGTPRANAGTASSKAFNPHDLSGFWDLTNAGLPRGALNETSNNRPQMTPWGLEKFRKTKTGVANALSNGASPNEKDWNDPIRWCDPTGFPRVMWNPTPTGMRFAHADDEVIQFFQNNRAWRDIWTDGRKLPGEDADARWYGYAVGHWEGDTFVVNSNNFDEATWLDQYGSPHSDQMTVEERYRRVDHDHLEMTLNITDPKAYVGTWKGDKKIFQLVEKPTRSAFNDFTEDICVWSETKREVHR